MSGAKEHNSEGEGLEEEPEDAEEEEEEEDDVSIGKDV